MLIDQLIEALDPVTVAQKVGRPFDDVRVYYRLDGNVATTFADFRQRIGHFYSYLFSRCVSNGGTLDLQRAIARAETILEREYHRRGGTIMSAFNDAHDGTDGGMRAQLDRITEALKAEAVGEYVRSVFEEHVSPNSWDDQIALIRQLFARAGRHFHPSIRLDQPERYAGDYQELVQTYVDGMRRTSAALRRH